MLPHVEQRVLSAPASCCLMWRSQRMEMQMESGREGGIPKLREREGDSWSMYKQCAHEVTGRETVGTVYWLGWVWLI